METIKIHDKILLRNRSYFKHGYILMNEKCKDLEELIKEILCR